MKINAINGYKQNFGHISSQAVDAVRRQAEGYRVSNKTGESFYNTNPKYQLMNSDELQKLEDLTLRASMLDNSWIYYLPAKGLAVDFYKDCNPAQIFTFDSKKDGNAKDALMVLECAVGEAETGEYAEIDENKNSGMIWNTDKKSVNYVSDRFRSQEDNKTLKRIYDKTFDVKF